MLCYVYNICKEIFKKQVGKMKKLIAGLLCFVLFFGLVACPFKHQLPVSEDYLDSSLSIDERLDNLLSQMTLDEKAGQMAQGDQVNVSTQDMKELGLGSILSGGGSIPNNENTIAS
jgi:hypothetical protein